MRVAVGAVRLPVSDAGDLRRRVSQAGADLVDLQFDDGAVGTVLRLVGALRKPALRDHAHALGQ